MQKKKDSDALKEANEKLKETTTLHKKKKKVCGEEDIPSLPCKRKVKICQDGSLCTRSEQKSFSQEDASVGLDTWKHLQSAGTPISESTLYI